MKAATGAAQAQQPVEYKQFRWEAITAIFTLILAGATISALVFSWQQISEFREAERVHQLVEQKRWFNSPEFRAVRRSLGFQRLDGQGKLKPIQADAAPQEMYDVLNYFDEIGLLEKKGYLNAEDVWFELGDWAFNFNEDGKLVIAHERQEDPYAYRNFERLVTTLQEIEIAKKGKPRQPTKEELEDFYRYSEKLSVGISAPKPGH